MYQLTYIFTAIIFSKCLYYIHIYIHMYIIIVWCLFTYDLQHGADPVQMAQLHKNLRVLNLLIGKYDCKPVFLPDIMEVRM